MALFQVLPAALNQWAGNQFIPAPVNWAPRPKPLYEAALEQQAPTGQPSPAQQALGIGDSGFQGGGINTAGQQNTREAKDFGDFLGSTVRGVGMVTNPVGFGLGMANLAGPTRIDNYNLRDAIPGIGIVDAARGAMEALGIGPGELQSALSSQSPEALGMPGFGDVGGGGSDYGPSAQEAAETGGYQGSGMYYKGGKVTKLLAPDPSGPDHGYAGLQLGEYVVKKGAAVHYGKGLMDAINDKKIDKVKLKGLLERP